MPSLPTTTDDNVVSPHRLIQGLERRLMGVVLAVTALLLVDQAVLQPLLVRLNGLAPAINLAGRQRMLSQRITKAALAMSSTTDASQQQSYREELSRSVADWSRVHRGLLNGDEALQLPPPPTPAIAAAFESLQAPFDQMRAAALRLEESANVEAPDADLAALLVDEPQYLRQMDGIVALYEHEAHRQVTLLRGVGLAASAVVALLLVGLSRFVLHPAAQLIRGQMETLTIQRAELQAARDELEYRVDARTAELQTANVSLAREMAEHQAADERNLALHNELAHASRITSLGQLATGLAHELNQPLAAIANFAEAADVALSGAASPAEVRPHFNRIRDAALRAGQIVRRMRNFVRPAASTPQQVALCSLIDEVAQLCAPEVQRGQVLLCVDSDGGGDCTRVDPIQIQQVLVNLVQNALQAMRSTPPDLRRLTIRQSRTGDELQVDVEDTGPGFPADRTELVSQPFSTTKPDGLGLGLAISRSILLAHGGRLWAANRATGGARVSFSLPALTSHPNSADAAVVGSTPHGLCRR